ncbi:sensor histidine kinase [Flavobacteriaceae bacterium GSB9]|nr:sensor histidine kinase [Flavobacteriaceae bacterium GSB9]
MLKKVFSALFVLFAFYGLSQSPKKHIDSLKQVLASNPKDSIRVKSYSDLCWYYRTVSADSAFAYGKKALSLAKQTKNEQGIAQAYNDLGILYYDISDFNTAIAYYKNAMDYREGVKDSMGMASAYNKLGIAYKRLFKMDSAIFYATNALKIYQAKNHLKYASIIKNNIGNIYHDLKQYDKALETYLEVVSTYKGINDLIGLSHSYTNIGNVYLSLKDTVQSLNYYKKGVEISKSNGFKKELGTLYNNIGGIYKEQNKYREAMEAFEKSLKIRQEIRDNYGVASTVINMGSVLVSTGALRSAEKNLRLGLKLAKETDAKELQQGAYSSLLSYYAIKKNADSVLHYQKLYKSIQDSIFSDRVTKEVAEIQEKYNASQREKQILMQRTNLAEKELDISRKNMQLLGLGVLVVVALLLGYMLYAKQKLKTRQLRKESELKEALIKIETQNRLQEQRLRISRDLHDNIGAQLTFIISSVENLQYGFKITNEKLTDKLNGISNFTKKTIAELRDTIWAMNKRAITLEDLQARISNFIDNANLSSSGINFEFNVNSNVEKTVGFTSVKGMNIYRIMQESINNALKYAQPTVVQIDIKKDKGKIVFAVTDNGVGFNETEVEKGNGLNNMQKRADEIGAVLKIESRLNSGTKIALTC